MPSVFLSHSSKDKPFVRELAGFLEKDGDIKVWLDEREIAPGQNIVGGIKKGLDFELGQGRVDGRILGPDKQPQGENSVLSPQDGGVQEVLGSCAWRRKYCAFCAGSGRGSPEAGS